MDKKSTYRYPQNMDMDWSKKDWIYIKSDINTDMYIK